ncbi:MAG: MFS transporter [Spirobacillus cienkowskii]|uniref:MFS transporter n=1 Tax=Spirobacillus cienkowskii TaxID=495820 RepID=A0A369KUD6_9BACT|nr:MAG: MFS transporter [Spirobacillus cienkowskii]
MNRKNFVKSYASSIFISFIEWFEFLIFVYIFLQIFDNSFLSFFQKSGILLSFFARPIGALIFGKLSVKKGRIYSLISTVNLMIISSFLIILATVFMKNIYLCASLAIIARIIQGAAIGAETTTSLLYIFEISKNKATAIAWGGLGSALGMALASYAPTLLSGIESIEIKIYLAYSLSIVISFIALFVRKSLIETKSTNTKVNFNKEYLSLSLNIFKYSFPFVFIVYYVFLIFPDYIQNTYNLTNEVSEKYITYFSIFTGFAPIFIGMIADKYGLDKVLRSSVILSILYIPIFVLVKDPFIHITFISLIMSLFFTVGLTKLFKSNSIDMLYIGFPFLYNLMVAIISSQIVLFFNIGLSHDFIFISSLVFLAILYIKDLYNMIYQFIERKVYVN